MKKCIFIIILLLTIILGGAYKFMIQGSATLSTDGRMAILLNANERDLVLAEMRAFLTSVQQITQAIADNDMALAASAAKKVGKIAQASVPGTLMGKLPMSFKKLGADTHTKFDQLAMDAESLGDANHTLTQLSTLMLNCVACHSAHRLDITKK
jgi:hypothetical protein